MAHSESGHATYLASCLCCFVPCVPVNARVGAALRDYQGTAVLMNTSAQLLNLLPHLGTKQLKQQKMAYAMAAAAGLEVHLALPEHASEDSRQPAAGSCIWVAESLPAIGAAHTSFAHLKARLLCASAL